MKVEFNGNTFSSEMGNGIHPGRPSYEIGDIGFLKGKKPLLLGVIALVASVINLPLAFFINLSIDFLDATEAAGSTYWLVVLYVFASLLLAASVTSGVCSTVSFAKGEKNSLNSAGLIMSIFSFVICLTCIILNILSLAI